MSSPGNGLGRPGIVLLGSAGLVEVLYLLWRPGVLTRIPGWFWQFHDTPFAAPGWLIVTAIVPLVAMAAVRRVRRDGTLLLILIAVALANQYACALLEGRGLDAIVERMVTTGHAQFARTAVARESFLDTARSYEDLLRNNRLGSYCHTKPPGQLMLYMATARLANAGRWGDPADVKLGRLLNAAAVTWPLISCMVLVPLFFLGRSLYGSESARVAAAMYAFVPSAVLITLHTDQVFFPILFLLPALLARSGIRRDRPALSLLSGICAAGAVYFSYPLILAVILVGGIVALRTKPMLVRSGSALLHPACFALGFGGAGLAMTILLHFHPVQLFRHAMAVHRAWKGWDPSLPSRLAWAGLNIAEFALWIGLPLALLFIVSTARSIHRAAAWRLRPPAVMAGITAGLLLLLALFGTTRGEVARLWLFLLPPVCLVAAQVLRRARRNPTFLLFTLCLQQIIVLLIKARQDFW